MPDTVEVTYIHRSVTTLCGTDGKMRTPAVADGWENLGPDPAKFFHSRHLKISESIRRSYCGDENVKPPIGSCLQKQGESDTMAKRYRDWQTQTLWMRGILLAKQGRATVMVTLSFNRVR